MTTSPFVLGTYRKRPNVPAGYCAPGSAPAPVTFVTFQVSRLSSYTSFPPIYARYRLPTGSKTRPGPHAATGARSPDRTGASGVHAVVEVSHASKVPAPITMKVRRSGSKAAEALFWMVSHAAPHSHAFVRMSKIKHMSWARTSI